MKLIGKQDINQNINHFFYYTQDNIDTISHIIFKLVDIDDNIAVIENGYMFNIPKANWHAFLYPIKDNKLILDTIQKIYVLSNDEYCNTYFMFTKYDKCLLNQLPTKIIQDTNVT